MWLFLFCLLSVASADILFQTNDGYDFETPLTFTTVYAEFHDCNKCTHFYTANYQENDEIAVQVLVPAHQTDKINVIKIFGPDPKLQLVTRYEVNHMLFSVGKIIYEIDTIASTNTSVILQIDSASPHAHYAVSVGKVSEFNFLNWTLKFPYLVQGVRYWMSTFVIYLFFLLLAFLYFITWPLQRYKSYVIFPKLAIFSYGAWLLDTFYQYFYIVQYTSDWSILTFLVHIVPNLIYITVLLVVYETTLQKEFILLGVAIVSLFIGGGGAYLGSLFLIVAYIGLVLMKNNSEQYRDKKVLVCGFKV